jgi:phage-related baseplate assembly protein
MPVIVPNSSFPSATGTPQTVPVDLPTPSFVNDSDGLDPTSVLNDMVTLFESYTSRTLYPAQVEQLLINLYAYREILLRNAIQYCGIQNLLAFAVYPMLDYIGEYLGCTRLPAQPATTTEQFTLTAAQLTPTTIPAGTQIGTQDGLNIFATTAALVIAVGQTVGTVGVQCTTAGLSGNGYIAGQVSVLLGSFPLVAIVTNIATTANGSNGEPAGTTAGDNHYRARIQAAPNNLTTAGPSGQYRSLALDVSSTIVDVQVPTQPTTPGTVQVYVLTGPVTQPSASPNSSGIASGTLLSAVQSALSAQNVRPLCDSVIVSAVTEVDYTVTGAITLYANANYATIAAGITAAAQNLALTLAANIEQDIVLSQWQSALSVSGVYDMQLTLAANIGGTPLTPTSDGSFLLTSGQWANCENINLAVVMGTKNQPVS